MAGIGKLPGRLVVGLLFVFLVPLAWAGESCRIAYDMGSSGIRAGSSASLQTQQVDIDYLGPLWAGRGLESVYLPTVAALRDLPREGGFAAACPRVGGGFSAWRLALQQDADGLADLLARLHAASEVAVLVVPQVQEGAYGYRGARQLLGERLTTSHILDIGGGSLQIAGARTTFGEPLGQKVWHRALCQEIRNAENSPCHLQAMTGAELAAARALLAEKLQGLPAALPEKVTMTAISRPVSRGVLPAVARLFPEVSDAAGLHRTVLSAAIERLARLTYEESIVLLGGADAHMVYLISDMLLVEGLMAATASDYLSVAELDLTNLPGLLADEQAFAWEKHYACYLERLREQGLAAYASNPETCQ